jgi:hypothetical protein
MLQGKLEFLVLYHKKGKLMIEKFVRSIQKINSKRWWMIAGGHCASTFFKKHYITIDGRGKCFVDGKKEALYLFGFEDKIANLFNRVSKWHADYGAEIRLKETEEIIGRIMEGS